jgi:competence protein ComEA
MKRIFSPALCLSVLSLAPAVLLAGPVDINTADAATLAAELNGVGPALAEAIIRDRMENGMFASPEDLTRVKGIGERIVEMNKPNILVSSPDPR